VTRRGGRRQRPRRPAWALRDALARCARHGRRRPGTTTWGRTAWTTRVGDAASSIQSTRAPHSAAWYATWRPRRVVPTRPGPTSETTEPGPAHRAARPGRRHDQPAATAATERRARCSDAEGDDADQRQRCVTTLA
jgi:hypothetical protein